MPQRTRRDVRFLPRLRVTHGEEIALGPGKVDLLEAIGSTGSIAAAAKSLGMSYMRAWMLVRTMNGCFVSPLVEALRGGSRRGGARLTPRGTAVLRLYREMHAAAGHAIAKDARALRRHLR